MKKYVTATLLLIVLSSLLGFLAMSFVVNKKIQDKGEVYPSLLTFFHETYDENREQFRKLAASLQREFSDVEVSKFTVKSEVDSDLTIDAVYIPAQQEANKLLIMTSGVHGIEGFTGSAVQQYFMIKVLSGETLENMGALLIRQYVGNLLSPDKKFVRVAFEYGTLNSQHILGASRSLHNMIIENQGFHHGYETSETERLVKHRFREMFFPSSEIWRSQIMKQTSEILPVLIGRYKALK